MSIGNDATPVAILILVDFLLQYLNTETTLILIMSRNPYFSGLSFAMSPKRGEKMEIISRNPYFSGLSFAIGMKFMNPLKTGNVAILILVDFLLQFKIL